MNIDQLIISIASDYEVTDDGKLSRLRATYKTNKGPKVKLGVGFDYLDAQSGYMLFGCKLDAKSKRRNIKSHRMIFYLTNGYLPDEVDHIDHNKANNLPGNLRGSSRSQNCQNTSSRINSTSRFLGVCWFKKNSKWMAQISTNGKKIYLGSFTCEKEAAKAYNKAATEYYGEFANLNNIDGPLS